MDKTFIVITNSTCTTEYRVKAKTKKQAEELFYEGNYEDSTDTDFQNETVIEVRKEFN